MFLRWCSKVITSQVNQSLKIKPSEHFLLFTILLINDCSRKFWSRVTVLGEKYLLTIMQTNLSFTWPWQGIMEMTSHTLAVAGKHWLEHTVLLTHCKIPTLEFSAAQINEIFTHPLLYTLRINAKNSSGRVESLQRTWFSDMHSYPMLSWMRGWICIGHMNSSKYFFGDSLSAGWIPKNKSRTFVFFRRDFLISVLFTVQRIRLS